MATTLLIIKDLLLTYAIVYSIIDAINTYAKKKINNES